MHTWRPWHALHASDGGCAVPSAAGTWGDAASSLIRQILFTGVDALPVTSVIALLLGIIIVTQAGTQLPRLGAGGLVGSIIVVTVIRELGPLITAFIVVGRSGTAIATELGNMSVTREVVALRLMGIPINNSSSCRA